jgi:curli biogenesis system outer membrane secretion channel CsgG/copper chaperone CopZ
MFMTKNFTGAAIILCGFLHFPLHAQPKVKTRLAVVDFQIKVEQAQKALGTAMSDLLIDALVETGRYTILERSALQEIREEQMLALSGEVDAATGAEVGKLIGAEFLVVGVVSKFEEKTGGGGLGGLVKGTALGGVGWYNSELGITIRIISANTGEIVASEKINQKETAIGLAAISAVPGGAAGGGLYKSKSMQTAMEKAIVKAVEVIGEQIPGGEEPATADSTGTSTIEVTAKNVDFATSRLFAKTLEAISGVKSVKSSFEGKTANIKVKYQGAAEDLADAIVAAEIAGFKCKIESLAASKIMMKVDKAK